MHMALSMLTNIALILSLCSSSAAYGYIGHKLIADLSSDLVSQHTLTNVHRILNGRPLSSIASWADSIKRYPQYRFSSELHYINFAHDDPPKHCEFAWTAPGSQEVIAAIHNYTSRLIDSEEGSWRESESLRFLVHYVADLHQPLHLSGRARGGNDLHVIFEGHKMSLHRVWDSAGLSRRIHDVVAILKVESSIIDDSINVYKDYLHGLLATEYADERNFWLTCHDSANTDHSKIQYCPEDWAQELVSMNCNMTWLGVSEGSNLDYSYWQNLQDQMVFERLITMAAVRLAGVLDTIFSIVDDSKHVVSHISLSSAKYPDL